MLQHSLIARPRFGEAFGDEAGIDERVQPLADGVGEPGYTELLFGSLRLVFSVTSVMFMCSCRASNHRSSAAKPSFLVQSRRLRYSQIVQGRKMMKANRSFEIAEIEKLGDVFRRYPGIRAVYLFGSAAVGHARSDSDIDLAIIPADTSIRDKKLDILGDLAARGYCDVDLVFIDESDLVLAYEAIRQNKMIYAVSDFDRGTTYSNIVRKYLDFEFFLRAQQEEYKRRAIGAKP